MRARREAVRLAAQLSDARLSALRMQMQPHFLYNSLNAITVILRDRDTVTATRMLEQLGEMLRRVMRRDGPQEVTLADEIGFLRQLLAIEEIRFSDRLRPEFDVDPLLLNAAVPEFILQPLVENALRHGLAQRVDATLLRITARRDADDLVLIVADDGPGPASETNDGAGGGRRTVEHPRAPRGALRCLPLRSRWPPCPVVAPRPPCACRIASWGHEMADIRTLIVDDESLGRRGIRQLLAPYPEFVVVGECRDGHEAVRALATQEPDLVFLDVEMPGLDGLGVIRVHGADRMPLTVFVTAHDEFAVRAFDARALDYLVKPLGEARFRVMIERVRERLRLNDAVVLAGQLSSLLAGTPVRAAGLGPPPPESSLLVDTETGQLVLDAAEIQWIGADDSFSALHAGGKRYRVRDSLHHLEGALDPAQFLRIHRSAIVRLDQVREVRVDDDARDAGAAVILRDGTRLPVARRKLSRLKALLRPWTK